MNRIFASLYLDEDVSVLLADIIRSKGFEVATVRDVGQLSADEFRNQLIYV